MKAGARSTLKRVEAVLYTLEEYVFEGPHRLKISGNRRNPPERARSGDHWSVDRSNQSARSPRDQRERFESLKGME